MEDTGEKRRKYGKYSDFLEDVWYNLWKIIKSYRLDSIDESGMDNQELSIEYSSEIYLCNYKLSKCRYYHVQL